MKTRYSLDYLHRKYKNMLKVVAWGNTQATTLQEAHGVPFVHGRGAGEVYRFSPYYDETTPEINDPEILVMLLERCKNERYFTGFDLLAKETGLSLATIAGAAKWLIRNQYALVGRGLDGKPTSIRWYFGDCKIYMQEAQDTWEMLRNTQLVRSRGRA